VALLSVNRRAGRRHLTDLAAPRAPSGTRQRITIIGRPLAASFFVDLWEDIAPPALSAIDRSLTVHLVPSASSAASKSLRRAAAWFNFVATANGPKRRGYNVSPGK
jgi:hypothetical protein